MLKFKSTPFEEEIEKATNENNLAEDWALIMHICDNAINYQDGAKFCFKAIMKRLHHNVPRVVLQALTLLDACVKNCDRNFLLQVASSDFTAEVRKLLPKMHPSNASMLKELLQKWSLEEFKDDPELCIIPALYYKLKSEAVEFPSVVKETKPPIPMCTDPDAVSSQEEENDIIKAIEMSLKDTGRFQSQAEYGTLGSQVSGLPSSLPEPFKVRTLYDFEAAEDNELTIKLGEIVLVLDNSNSSWWKGSNHRGEGLFPANFVTEDLNFPPEELPVVQETGVEEKGDSSNELSKDVEVKLDEEKIEMAINWLNEADPTGEIPDPDDMLLLERECSKMAPLIEENLQDVDNRLALLNLVNKQIVDSFDSFYSLSNSVSSSNPSVDKKFSSVNYNKNIGDFANSQVSSAAAAAFPVQQGIHPAAMHGAYYVPAPSVGSQFIMSSELMHGRPICAVQSPSHPQPSPVPAYFHPQIVSQSEINAQLTQNPDIDSMPAKNPVSNSTETSQLHTVPHMQYVQPVPFPAQPYGHYAQNSGYIQGPNAVPNYVMLPYPMSSVHPYFSPPYYLNSNVPTSSGDLAFSSTSNDPICSQLPEPVKKSHVSTKICAAPINVIDSSYSNDLQQINMSLNAESTDPSTNESVRTDRITSHEVSNLAPQNTSDISSAVQSRSAYMPIAESL